MAVFFKNELVQPVVAVIGIGFVIGSFGVVQKALLTREMAFKKLAIIEVAGVLVAGITAVILAVHGAGVWSLVANVLLRDLISVVTLWFVSEWKPTVHFKKSEFIEFYRFSANVLANDVAIYLVTNTDITIIGRVLGDVMLGVYNYALYLVKLPVTRISGIVTKVVFPAFSLLQHDKKQFKRGFLKSITFVSLVTFPLLVGLAVFSREFILVILGEKWLDARWPMVILTPMAMLKSVGTLKGSVLMAVGKPEIELRWNFIYLAPLAGIVYLGTQYGLVGVAIAFSTFYMLTFPIIQHITNKQVDVRMREFWGALAKSSAATTAMLAAALGWRLLLFNFFNAGNLVVLLTGVLISAVVYIGAVFLIDSRMLYEMLYLLTRNKRFKRETVIA